MAKKKKRKRGNGIIRQDNGLAIMLCGNDEIVIRLEPLKSKDKERKQ